MNRTHPLDDLFTVFSDQIRARLEDSAPLATDELLAHINKIENNMHAVSGIAGTGITAIASMLTAAANGEKPELETLADITWLLQFLVGLQRQALKTLHTLPRSDNAESKIYGSTLS